MENFTESIAQQLRNPRHGLLAQLPNSLYLAAKQTALSILYLLSRGRGRSVKVTGIYPLQVEWERSAVDFKTWEAEFIKAFGDALQSPKIVIDVGASIGEWSALAVTLVGSKNVHVFEPNPPSWKHIQKVFQLNSIPTPVCIFPGFAANSDSFNSEVLAVASSREWPLIVEDSAEFESFLSPKNLPSIKLDTYCKRLGVVPSIIKLDVEGAEGEVLRGSQNLLETFQPLVFLSLHPWALKDFGDSKADLLSWIEERGYNCSLLATVHEEHWLCAPKG